MVHLLEGVLLDDDGGWYEHGLLRREAVQDDVDDGGFAAPDMALVLAGCMLVALPFEPHEEEALFRTDRCHGRSFHLLRHASRPYCLSVEAVLQGKYQ